MTLLGYFLGQVSFISDHLEATVLAVVALSLVPILVEVLRARRERTRAAVELQ
jgi:membrane-associated protein